MVWIRVALGVAVLAWLFGPSWLRSAVPLWLPFLVVLGLELAYFAGAWRSSAAVRADRGPQPVDLERYGFPPEGEEAPPFYVPPRAGALRRLTLGLAVLAVAGGFAWLASRSPWERLDGDVRRAATQRFSAEATRIVGRRVEIRCDEAGEFVGAVQHADGVAVVGGSVAYLTPQICHDLHLLAFEGEISSARTGRALAVLAHEAWHLRGERNEGTTECYALQSGVELGTRLGLRESTARQLMRQQLAENQLRAKGALEYLVPAGCRDGGPLDLRPAEPGFP